MRQNYKSSMKQVLGYAQTVHGLAKVTKRAWAEYFEMERRINRQAFLIRLYGTLLLGMVIGLVLDKLT